MMLDLPLPDTSTFCGDELARDLDRDGYSGVSVEQYHPAVGPPVLRIEGNTAGGASIGGNSRAKVEGLLTAHQSRREARRNLSQRARAAKNVAELAAIVAELTEG